MTSQAQINLGTTSQATISTLPLTALKTTIQTIDTDDSLNDDEELFLALGANETWDTLVNLRYTSGATPDIKVAITVPSGGNFDGVGTVRGASGLRMVETTAAGPFGGTAADELIVIQGVVRMGSTAGNVTVQWAQNTSDGGDTSVLVGSSIKAWRTG